jgi:rhodanese-related sulfurtransferase
MSYAGDVSPQEAWNMLDENQQAILIDVRTLAEWAYVGTPDISQTGKETQFVSWVNFPAMERNEEFAAQVANIAPDKDTLVLFLCRSGVRSIAAAECMTAAGYTACYNVLQGFEGDMNDVRQRGSVGGWKAAGLAWIQS